LDGVSGTIGPTGATGPAGGFPLQNRFAIIKDIKSSGSNGQSLSTAGDNWNQRELNTINAFSTGITLSSDQFTIPTGSWRIQARAQAYDCDFHKIRLYQSSGTPTTISVGTSEYASNSGSTRSSTSSELDDILIITNTTTYQIDHYVSNAGTGGRSAGGGENEVYTTIIIEKLE
jgi:hypothetical protein